MYKTHQTHCGHNVQCFNVQSVCTQSNYWALKRKVHDGYREHDEMNNRRDGSARGSAKQTKAVNFTATRHKQESIFFFLHGNLPNFTTSFISWCHNAISGTLLLVQLVDALRYKPEGREFDCQ